VVESNGDRTAAAVLADATVVARADAVIPIEIGLREPGDGDEPDAKPDPTDAEAIDVGAAMAERGLRAYRGDLNDLRGDTIAMSRSELFDNSYRIGDRLAVTLPDGTAATLRLVAAVEDAPSLHADVLVPVELARSHAPHATAERWFVVPRGDPRAAVTTLKQRLGTATAEPAGAWIADRDAATRRSNSMSMWILLGPAGLYSALAIANTLLMGSLQRRREFVAIRLIGATGTQVRRMILAESVLVGLAALALGGLTTFIVGSLIRRSLGRGVAAMPVTVPWAGLTGIAVVCLAIAMTAALVPTWFVLRRVRPGEATAW
jgi:putative ABC transport system permease protein